MDQRGKLMITVAWIASFICSLPQVICVCLIRLSLMFTLVSIQIIIQKVMLKRRLYLVLDILIKTKKPLRTLFITFSNLSMSN